MNPDQVEQLQRTSEFLNSKFGPHLLKMVSYISNDRFMEPFQLILESGKTQQLLLTQLGVIFVFVMLRSYVSGKLKGFWDRIIFSALSFMLYLGVFMVVIPLATYGRPYLDLMSYTGEFLLKEISQTSADSAIKN